MNHVVNESGEQGDCDHWTPYTDSVSLWTRVGTLCARVAVALCLVGGDARATSTGHPRRHTIDSLIIHSLGGPDCKDGTRFFKEVDGDALSWAKTFASLPGVSIHYVIGRDGTVVSAVPEDLAASHAIGWNQRSIGIELVNNGDGTDPFPAAQIAALVRLAREIRKRHGDVALERVLRHSDVDHTMFPAETFGAGCAAYRRKLDPGAAFPWEAFRVALGR